MKQLVSLHEARNFVEDLGYDIFPFKKGDYYKVMVWKGETCLGEGRHEYKSWQTAVNETILSFYEKFKDNG